MPYRTIEDRKAAYDRWRAKNPERYKELYQIQNAKKATLNPRLTIEQRIEKATKTAELANARLAALTQTQQQSVMNVSNAENRI